MFGRKNKIGRFAVVTARRTGDNIAYSTVDTTTRSKADRMARETALKGGVFVAVIDYTGQPHWCYGRRVAWYGEEL